MKKIIQSVSIVALLTFVGCSSGGFTPKNDEEKAMLEWAKTQLPDAEFLSIEEVRKELGIPKDCPHRDQVMFRSVRFFAKAKNGALNLIYGECKESAKGYECKGSTDSEISPYFVKRKKEDYKEFCGSN